MSVLKPGCTVEVYGDSRNQEPDQSIGLWKLKKYLSCSTTCLSEYWECYSLSRGQVSEWWVQPMNIREAIPEEGRPGQVYEATFEEGA